MKQTIINLLVENSVIDFKKNELSKYERANILRSYMKQTNKGLTAMAKFLGVPKTTIHYWLKWENVSPTKHNLLIECGITETQITNALKCNKNINELKPNNILDKIIIVQDLINKIRCSISSQPVDKQVIDALKQIVKDTNYAIMRAEGRLK